MKMSNRSGTFKYHSAVGYIILFSFKDLVVWFGFNGDGTCSLLYIWEKTSAFTKNHLNTFSVLFEGSEDV